MKMGKGAKLQDKRMRKSGHEAWLTRQRNLKARKQKKSKGHVVGFYKKEGETRPITKSDADLRRQKIVKGGKQFKGVQVKGAVKQHRGMITVKKLWSAHWGTQFRLKSRTASEQVDVYKPKNGKVLVQFVRRGRQDVILPYKKNYVGNESFIVRDAYEKLVSTGKLQPFDR